jgi:hypothetical protein
MSAAVTRPETITLDDTVKKANAEQSVWQFNGEAGNFVTIEVQAEEGEPWLKLYNGQFNIQSESVLVPRIEALLPEEGDYYLELGWFDEAQPYTLSTAVMEPETILLGDEVEANAEQKVWQFEGKAGEQVTINVTAAEGRDPWLALYNSNYENLLYNDNFEGLNPQVELLLPEDGPYYLQVGWVDDPGPYVMKTEAVTGKDVASFGTSGNGTPLTYYQYGEGPQPIIFIGGIHAGFAPSSVKMAERLIAHLEENPDEIPENATVYIIPNLNPDSVYAPGELDGRFNSFGVDLNRNWNCIWQTDATILGIPRTGGGGREVFSEPEVKALRKFITNYDFILNKKPAAILFWGARATNGLVSPGSCGPVPEVSQPLADVYGTAAGFEVLNLETIGAPISGDVSNWLDSFGIPAAFVLLKDYEDFKWEENLEGVRAVLQEFGK